MCIGESNGQLRSELRHEAKFIKSASNELLKKMRLCICWGVQCEGETFNFAETLGGVIDVEKEASDFGIKNVQILRPRRHHEAGRSTYSGIFGLGEFPLHSDYAHWSTPPRFLVLRCIIGYESVKTSILPFAAVVEESGNKISRAIVAPRRKHPQQEICAMPLLFERDGIVGFRWDSVFLQPLNNYSKEVAFIIDRLSMENIDNVALKGGDVLILDNWKVMHGRSSVLADAIDRRIDRFYLSNIFGCE